MLWLVVGFVRRTTGGNDRSIVDSAAGCVSIAWSAATAVGGAIGIELQFGKLLLCHEKGLPQMWHEAKIVQQPVASIAQAAGHQSVGVLSLLRHGTWQRQLTEHITQRLTASERYPGGHVGIKGQRWVIIRSHSVTRSLLLLLGLLLLLLLLHHQGLLRQHLTTTTMRWHVGWPVKAVDRIHSSRTFSQVDKVQGDLTKVDSECYRID